MPPQQLLVDVEAPVGTRAAVTDSIVRKIERELDTDDRRPGGLGVRGGHHGGRRRRREPHGRGTERSRGRARHDQPGGLPGPGRATRSRRSPQMQDDIGKDVAGATITVDKPNEGPPQGAPVNIEIVGEDPAQLKALSDQVLDDPRERAGLPEAGGPRERPGRGALRSSPVHVDREKAALYDLNTLEGRQGDPERHQRRRGRQVPDGQRRVRHRRPAGRRATGRTSRGCAS